MAEKTVEEIAAMLSEPFDPDDIEWRIQGTPKARDNGEFNAMILPYLTNRAVQNRLDKVFGPFGWQNAFRESETTKGGVYCGIGAKVFGEWIWKWDGAPTTDVEAFKGGISDSQKRCAVQWGVGRYLYALPKYWGTVEKKGDKFYVIPDPSIPHLPSWALPAGYVYPDRKVGSTQAQRTEAGKVEDKKATTTPSAQNKASAAQQKAPTQLAPAQEKATTESMKKQAQSAGEAQAQKETAKAPEGGDKEVMDKIAKAKTYAIPKGLPDAGKPIGEILDSKPRIGIHLLKLITGEAKGAETAVFKPTTDEDKKLVAAAKYLLEHLPQEQPAAK